MIWKSFLDLFNGHSLWQEPFCLATVLNLFTDASEAVGYGAFWKGHWSADEWSEVWHVKGVFKGVFLSHLQLHRFWDLVPETDQDGILARISYGT